MARPRRRIKFQPFRMGERFRNTILVGLGVFLMAIFAVPFQGSCQRHTVGGRSPNDVFVTFAGKSILYGQVTELRRLHHLVFGRMQAPLTDEQAAFRLAAYYEAQRAGIRVPDDEVIETIHSQIFPRRLKVEYVIAEDSAFGKDLPVPESESAEAYNRDKDKRFRTADGTYRPLSEVRETLLSELRAKKGSPLARVALDEFKTAVDALVGAPLENGLKQLANERKLRFGETQLFTYRTAVAALRPIGDAPDVTRRVSIQPIGQLAEPLAITGGWCVFRVVSRSRGFGQDGAFHPEEEGWVRQGFGVINLKSEDEVLQEMGVTQAELQATVRQELSLGVLPSLVESAVSDIPITTLRARYRRDNTRALAAYFALRTREFAQGVTYTEEELRDFYARHKDTPRTPQRPGYRQPERVQIEYVLGRTGEIADKLAGPELLKYYERNSAFFGPSFKDVQEKVRKRLAEEKLEAIISQTANRAADQAASGRESNLQAVAAQEAREFPSAFAVATTPLFSAEESEDRAFALRGAKIPEILFGERGHQYAVAGAEAKPGAHAISEVFSCEAGRFFFRVVKREASREIPYDSLPPDLREELIQDVRSDKAFVKAKEAAGKYRGKVYQGAFERFAERVGTKPLDTEFLKPKDPIPSLGQPVPALYDQLAGGEVGDLSDVVEVGERFVLARLAAREEAKGNRFQIASCGTQNLPATYEPAAYELRAAYDAAPYSYLDRPTPIAFEKVKGEIAKRLAQRQALKLATERTEKALAELAGVQKPDLSAVASKHGLQVRRDVAVDLARPEATPEIGKAAGFRDAATALKPGEVSRILSSADGRFLFALKSRSDKAATIDLAAALYAPLRAEAKIDDKEARQYYDEHRDAAYVTGDEIKEAPPWDTVSATARDRVKQKLQDDWAKKPPGARLTALRDSLVCEAFRTVPPASPLQIHRTVHLTAETLGPFPLSKPEGVLANEPEAMAAVRALKPGELTKPLAVRRGALIALETARRPGGLARAQVAIFRAADFVKSVPEPAAAAVQGHFDAHKADFQIPAEATIEFLFADTATRQRAIEGALTELDCRRYYEERADTVYLGASYEASETRVRADLARERAQRDARAAANGALDALLKDPKPAEADLAALAKKVGLTYGKSQPFPLQDPVTVAELGRVRDLSDALRDAKPGQVVPRVAESSLGFAVCRLVARTAAREPKLDEVRARVADALRLAAARDALGKAAQGFRAAAQAGSFDKAAAASSPAPKTVATELLDARQFILPGGETVPALTDAIFALAKPGLTPVVTEGEAATAFVALVTDRQPDELVTLETTTLGTRELMITTPEEPTDEELKKHYEANQETFRRPETVQAEYLAAPYAQLAKALPALSEDELRKEYQRSVDAGEANYRDWAAAAQPAFLPLDKARPLVRERLGRLKAHAEADKIVGEALKALRAAGAQADLKAYAAKHPTLLAGESGPFDREQKGIELIGAAPDLAKMAFAAKKGDLVGPITGTDGVCLLRVLDHKPAYVPPFDEKIKFQVEMSWQRKRDVERAVQAAGKLHEKLAAALAKAGEKERTDAFRKCVEGEPLTLDVPQPVPVTLARPIYPLDSGRGRSSFITGLGQKPDLVVAIFRQRPADLTPVVQDPERTGCYVALVVQLLEPKPPTEADLFATRYGLAEITEQMITRSWQLYLDSQMQRE